MNKLKFFIVGILFGIILIKSEVISWFRIQEMFRFQSFHMYGVMCCAMAVGIISVLLIRKFNVKTMSGDEIKIAPKTFNWGNVFGGFTFGLGWALTGACPGPIYALLGSGIELFGIVFLSAVLGTYVYGLLKDRLPH